ncbi:MAG: aminotransferase class IV, partial [Oscillospiraceae bacterium]|nr:aminotransferase class IV [Oscillospiraceae bacterium]
MDIRIELTQNPKTKPADESKLGFGKIFTDHMFMLNYTAGIGWHDARIVPYGPFSLDPSSMVFHYAQEVFEGMKAYRTADGTIQLFRPYENARRFNNSCERLCIPALDEDIFVSGLKKLVEIDKDWVPHSAETSLYLRPFVIATDAFLGVHASKTYIFAIIASPSGCYYPEGINPVRIYVESK